MLLTDFVAEVFEHLLDPKRGAVVGYGQSAKSTNGAIKLNLIFEKKNLTKLYVKIIKSFQLKIENREKKVHCLPGDPKKSIRVWLSISQQLFVKYKQNVLHQRNEKLT